MKEEIRESLKEDRKLDGNTDTAVWNGRDSAVGFIGFGNMATAMAKGIAEAGHRVYGITSGRDMESARKRSEEAGAVLSESNLRLAEDSDVIFLTVKPYMLEEVLKEISPALNDSKTLITVSPGITMDYIREKVGEGPEIVLTMPNTPAMIGEGLTLVHYRKDMDEDRKKEISKLLETFGKAVEVTEKMLLSGGSLNGCTPAYVYMLIEALSDAGVTLGFSRKDAIRIAAQTVSGAAQMVLQTGMHPGELKDMVTSPSGTTIEGVRSLEENGFRYAAMEAVLAAYRKSVR